MLVSSRRSICDFSISLNNEKLEQCDSYKYLGVFIDKDLSWKPHINHLCSKIAKACGALSKMRHIVGIETLKSIYHALINSYLRYGILSWGNASSESLKPLNTLINRAIRIMSFAPYGKLNIKPIFDHLKLLKCCHWREALILEIRAYFMKRRYVHCNKMTTFAFA